MAKTMTKIVNLLLAQLLIVGLTAVPVAAASTASSGSVHLWINIMDKNTGTYYDGYSESTLIFSDGSTMKQESYIGIVSFTFPRSRLKCDWDTVVVEVLFTDRYGKRITHPVSPYKDYQDIEIWV